MSDLVKELEALDAKATKGPWFMIGPPWNHETQYINAASADPHGGRIVCDFECQWDQDDGGDDSLSPRPLEDAATIAVLRNALPALIEYVKAQDRLVEMAIALSLELDKVQGIDTHPSLRIYAGVGANAMSTKSALLAALRGGK